MKTADLDFIKVTEVGGIVRYSSKPEEGLCYIPGVRMETKQEAINRLVNIAVNGCGGVVKYTVNGWEEVPTDNSLTAQKTRIEQALEDLRSLKCEEYVVVNATVTKLKKIYSDLKREEAIAEEKKKAEHIADLKAKRKAIEEEAIAAGFNSLNDYILYKAVNV